MPTELETESPYALAAGEGKQVSWFGSHMIIKASSPGIGITETVVLQGDEPPMHIHHKEDEWMYVLDGEVTFHVGGKNYFGKAGAFVFFPRLVPHTFTIETSEARVMVMNTPGGFERMFEAAPATHEDVGRVMEAFGMEIVGPHPRQTALA